MRQIFTLTAGRTGSAWLAELFRQNLLCDAVHEPIGINDFGIRMPDIRLMRMFNNYGNNEEVRAFWHKKFAAIQSGTYVETNHTLGKCGLIENIVLNGLQDSTAIVILKRNLVDQCCSYVQRHDFANITIPWQWYLHPSYMKIMVDPKPFEPLGPFATPVWYCYEMEARQEYYYAKFSQEMLMVKVNLENVTTLPGAQELFERLGYEGKLFLPEAKNASIRRSSDLFDRVTEIMENIQFDTNSVLESLEKEDFNFNSTI